MHPGFVSRSCSRRAFEMGRRRRTGAWGKYPINDENPVDSLIQLEIESFPDGGDRRLRAFVSNSPLPGSAGLMNTIPVLVDNCSTCLWPAMIMGFRSERASPGDVTVAGRIVGVAAFAKDPLCSGIGFAEGKVISGDVELIFGEALFRDGKLVHEGEA